MLVPPPPVDAIPLFPAERAKLLTLLASLDPGDWDRPTICAGWSVKDLVAHLVADDLGRLSRGRDGHRRDERGSAEPLVAFIDRRNGQWVEATRRLSPRVLRDLLTVGGAETQAWFVSLDPDAQGAPVSWAGPQPAPVWLDLAREYTERWHHQQQIRDAVQEPLLDEPAFLRPVLATFVHALPESFRAVPAPVGMSVGLTITGPSGGHWTVVREADAWTLYGGQTDAPAAEARIDQDTAWRLFTRAISPGLAEERTVIRGDPELARRVLMSVAIIA